MSKAWEKQKGRKWVFVLLFLTVLVLIYWLVLLLTDQFIISFRARYVDPETMARNAEVGDTPVINSLGWTETELTCQKTMRSTTECVWKMKERPVKSVLVIFPEGNSELNPDYSSGPFEVLVTKKDTLSITVEVKKTLEPGS